MSAEPPEWDFSDEPADLVPDDDPEILAGMARAAEAKKQAAAVPEERFSSWSTQRSYPQS